MVGASELLQLISLREFLWPIFNFWNSYTLKPFLCNCTESVTEEWNALISEMALHELIPISIFRLRISESENVKI